MKRIFITLFCLLSLVAVNAQRVKGYTFEATQGEYTPITDGTVIYKYTVPEDASPADNQKLNEISFWDSNRIAMKDSTGNGLLIGFDFKFNEDTVNRFVTGGLWLAVGKDEVSVDPTSAGGAEYFHRNENMMGFYPLRNLYAKNGTEISYKLQGEAPNRVLVVQYKDMFFFNKGYSGGGDTLTGNCHFQIRLYETTNNIEFCFSGWEMLESAPTYQSVNIFNGLRGSVEGDAISLSGTWDSPNVVVSAPSYGGYSISSISFSKTSFPADGLTYTFTYPVPCVEPAAQPTGLTLDVATDQISGLFRPAADAEYYITLISEKETLADADMPKTGLYYAVGGKIGDATVVAYSADTTFATMTSNDTIDLKAATQYYVHVLAVNDDCLGGPVYRTESPLSLADTTKPEAPASLIITKEGSTEVSLKATANTAGNKIIVAKTLLPGEDHVGNTIVDGQFGQPTADMQVGDTIEDGDIIIYTGAAAEFDVKDLPDNYLVHFKAWSVDEAGNVSTTGANANILTYGEVPFVASLDNQPYDIFGWDVEGFDSDRYSGNLLKSRVQQSAEGTSIHFQTQYINLPEGENRIILDYNMIIPDRFSSSPYEWKENDSLMVFITADEVKYDTLYLGTYADHLKQPTVDFYPRLLLPFTEYAGQKAKVKVVWKCFGGMDMMVGALEVEPRLACDYPVEVSVSDIEMNEATVAWRAQGSETLWEVRYRTGEEEWTVEMADKNPYTITGLPYNTEMEVQVRALCSAAETSLWSKSATFTSGYGLPFFQSFRNGLPVGWDFARGYLTDEGVDFCTDCTPRWEYTSGWRASLHITPDWQAQETDSVYDWFMFPMVDFGNGSYNYQLEFSLYLEDVAAEGNNESYYIVYSDADGKFTRANIIDTIKFAGLPNEDNYDSTYVVNLKGIKGASRVALYVESLGKPNIATIQVTNVAIQPTCPNDVTVSVDNITTTSAIARWKGTKDTDQEWLVAYAVEGSEATTYTATAFDTLLIEGLTPRTTYTVAVTKACAVGDTARPVVATFTALADTPCEPVTNVTVADMSKTTATITWTAEAYSYNVRFRIKDTEEWTVRNVRDNNIQLLNLMPATVYEYAVQAICSPATDDNSEYTSTDDFTTTSVTCFVPTEIVATPTHKSIGLTWKTAADSVEINWRKDGATEWTAVVVKDATTHTIADLEAETAYDIRVRSLCSDNDMSDWSEIIKTTTLAIPDCVVPTDLKADKVTDTSILTSWTADESNISWIFQYRAADVFEWIEVQDTLTEKTYLIEELKPATVYLWKVRALCDEGRESAFATQIETQTTDGTAVDLVTEDRLTVYTSDDVLNIINTEALYISTVALYTVDGTLISEHQVNDNQNIILPTTLNQTIVIVRITTPTANLTYKVLFN